MDDLDGSSIPDLHHVQVFLDGKLLREDHNVTEGSIFYHRAKCDNPECEASHGPANYTWTLECDTLTELDMSDGEPMGGGSG